MRVIFLAMLMLSQIAVAQEDHERPFVESDEPTQLDYDLAKEFEVPQEDMKEARARIKASFSSKKAEESVTYAIQDLGLFAVKSDAAIDKLIKSALNVLRHKKFYAEADQIEMEHQARKNFIQGMLAGRKDLGDHEAYSEWLTDVHNRIENLIGSYLCKNMRFHDLYIINHTIPVVFAPKKYPLPEYKTHFAGKQLITGRWLHHGLAGVVTYWTVRIACQIGTSGLGAIVFVCNPVAGLSEHVMDKRIAPPIAERVWKRAQP